MKRPPSGALCQNVISNSYLLMKNLQVSVVEEFDLLGVLEQTGSSRIEQFWLLSINLVLWTRSLSSLTVAGSKLTSVDSK